MKKFRSKIGGSIVIFVLFVLGGTSLIMIYNKIWMGLAINVLVLLFFTYILASTYYIIQDQALFINSGFFVKLKIPINSIYKIVETNNPISSPAASLDRIMIFYNKFDTVMISPVKKMEFINELLKINPDINVVLKIDKNVEV